MLEWTGDQPPCPPYRTLNKIWNPLSSFKSDFFSQSHWYSYQYIGSINHKHFRDSIALYLEIQTPAHKSHLCKYFTRAQCVFYVFFMSVERPHLEWHSLPDPLGGKKIQKRFTGSFSITYAHFPLRMSLCKNARQHVSSHCCSTLFVKLFNHWLVYWYPGCGDLLVR